MPFLLILLGLFFFVTKPTFAAVSVDFNVPDSLVSGVVVGLNYTLTGADIGSSYYLKAIDNTSSDLDIRTIYNNQELYSSSPWTSFPVAVIGAGGSQSGTIQIKALKSGTGSLLLKAGLTTNISDPAIKDKPITVFAPSPTPSPVPSNTPVPTATSTPSQTPTPTPTNTPAPQPSINIQSFPSISHVLQAFSMQFSMTNLKANTDYYFKGVGGIDGLENLETYNAGSWYGYTSSWDSMPKFTSDSNGKITDKSISMRVASGKPTGEYKVQIRVRIDGNNKDSDIKYLTVQSQLPTSTPTPPPTSPTVTPTFEPSPTPDLGPNDDIGATFSTTAASDSITLDDVVISPTPTPSRASQTTTHTNIPLLFMIAGGLLIVVPVAVSFVKNAKKSN